MTATIATSSLITFLSCSKLIFPSLSTFKIITSAPREISEFAASITHLCSVEAIIIFFLLWYLYLYENAPFIAKLLDSVAPEVNIISFSSAPITDAITLRLKFTASLAKDPKLWLEEWGLP